MHLWFNAGAECGEHQGKAMIIVRDLYGLKISGASWQLMLKEFIENNLQFILTQIYPNVYIRRDRRENWTEDYELLLVYMDYVLTVTQSPETIMKDIVLSFDIKDNKYGPPTAYLGANVEPLQMSDGKYVWSIKCESYVAAAIFF